MEFRYACISVVMMTEMAAAVNNAFKACVGQYVKIVEEVSEWLQNKRSDYVYEFSQRKKQSKGPFTADTACCLINRSPKGKVRC